VREKKPRNDMGDFQTPPQLANATCTILKQARIEPEVLVEPTCGKGIFVSAALECFSNVQDVYCVEIQQSHEQDFWRNMSPFIEKVNIELHHDDVFTHEFNLARFTGKQILVLGNPPWVTNTELSQLDSKNRPARSNFKKVRGIEALTGKGNFDIGEAIIIKIERELRGLDGWIAFLCKNSVIKNVVRDARVLELELSNLRAYEIDTKHEFGINTPGSLFIARSGSRMGNECQVANFYEPGHIIRRFGWVAERFVSDVDGYEVSAHLDGKSPLEWRQGVKNDAAKIMVLQRHDESTFVNRLGEVVDIEPDLVYPFVKGSALRGLVTGDVGTLVIITQTRLGEDTATIAKQCPRTWQYLNEHSNVLDARKSSMYKNKPRFALFGIGGYAFKPFKVAIASFYKSPHFSLVLPVDDKPTMLDDTCYYVSLDDIHDALAVLAALNSNATRSFLAAISFQDGKRVYSKDILMRLDLRALLEQRSIVQDIEAMIKQLPFEISDEMVLASRERLLDIFKENQEGKNNASFRSHDENNNFQ